MWTARRTPSKWRANSRDAGAAISDAATSDQSSDAGPVNHDLSDERLLERLRRREPAALAILHDTYSGGIYNLALRMVGNSQDAEDITHDVLLRAFEHLPRDRAVKLRPWLYRVTINRCYDLLRTAARRPNPDTGLASEVPARIDTFAQAELGHLLERSLAALTPRQRAAMLLKDVHGLSLDEAAEAMHVTTGSVEVLLARARNSFRAHFTELCQGDGRPEPSWSILMALPVMLGQRPLPATLQALPPASTGSLTAALSASVSAKIAVVMLAAGAAAAGVGIGLPAPQRPVTHNFGIQAATPRVAVANTLSASPSTSAEFTMSRLTPTSATTTSAQPSPAHVNGASPSRTHAKRPSHSRAQWAMNRSRAGQSRSTAMLRQLARDDKTAPSLRSRLAASGRLPQSAAKRYAARPLLPLATARKPANSDAATSASSGVAATPASTPSPASTASAAPTPSSTP
jgi:RNA polymerase sigma-70 factor (ECF subfamily)